MFVPTTATEANIAAENGVNANYVKRFHSCTTAGVEHKKIKV